VKSVKRTFSFEEIDAIINARSIAVVGASDKPAKFGTMLTTSQLAMDFDGPMYLVNPNGKEIFGQTVCPDLASLPEVPDLVYVTIPAHLSMQVLEDCARLGVKGVVIVAAGFRESGPQGCTLEEEALRIAEAGGFRIMGPNCFGIYNPRNRLTLIPGYDLSRSPGRAVFLSQSGGFSVHVARQGKSLGIDFRAVISYGNGADLDEVDLLRYFSLDPGTDVIAGYLEGTGDGRAFLEAVKEAASRKPVVLWKVGRCESAQRAVTSHTGSLAGDSEIWEAALNQFGVIPASGVDEVCDVLLALKHLGRRPGRRLLLCGGGGGLGTYAADLAAEEGLEVPDLEEGVRARTLEILGSVGSVVNNPLDIGTPLILLPRFEACLKEAAGNPTTDLLIFDLAVNFGLDMAGKEGLDLVAEAFVHARKESGKPIAAVLYTRSYDPEDFRSEGALRTLRWKLLENGVAVFPSMRRAIRAVSLVNR